MKLELMLSSHSSPHYVVLACGMETSLELALMLLAGIRFFCLLEYFLLSEVSDECYTQNISPSHSLLHSYMLRVNIKCCSSVTNVIIIIKNHPYQCSVFCMGSNGKRWVEATGIRSLGEG